MSRHRLQKPMQKKLFTIFLLICIAVPSLLPSVVQSAPWTPGDQTGPYLTPKWIGYVTGGGEALLTADVRSDYPGEEVFHAGGPVQPNSTAGSVTCLNGITGNQIWERFIYGIGNTATMQMADVDRDHNLEIIVTLQAPAGMYILRAKDGSVLWNPPGIYNANGTDYSGYFTPVGGRIDGSGVVGDTDNDVYPDIFIGVMGYEEQPNTGKIIHYEWDPTVSTIVERGRVQVWHPCAGGLSLADTDNDRIFELYMNERDVYFGDGSWGRGLTSFWADNLTKRWSIYDWGASSDIPMLTDVNKDGVVDVVTTNLGSGICVINSTNGRPITTASGTLFDRNLGSIHAHYQSTVYDIDGDGNLELLCADGTHNYTGTQIWDLNRWQLDADIQAGYSFRGPNVGDVTGDGLADIIIVTFTAPVEINGTTALYNNGTVQVYDRNYDLMDNYTGLVYRAIGSLIQDTDMDGLNELLVLTQSGIVYCFDTLGLSKQSQGLPRVRSEVHFYSESRLGASEYVPYERPWPDVISVSPGQNSVNVSTSLNELSFTLNHPLGEMMSYIVTTKPDIGFGSGSNVGNGLKSIRIAGLAPSTYYSWNVSVRDQSGHLATKIYSFTTAPTYSNTAPTQTTPLLSSTNGGNTVNENLICANQSTADDNNSVVTNIYNWFKNGAPIANLILAFDSKPDSNDIYSGTATTRDYSGNGNTGTIFGATWTSSGRVGGAFSLDGNDFIRVEEQGNSLGGNGTWNQMSLEFWIRIPTAFSDTKTLIWKPDRYYPDGSNSYKMTVSRSSSQLVYKWYIYTSENRVYSISSTLTSNLNTWHHVVSTYQSGIGLRLYVDGTRRATLQGSGNINATKGPLEIGFNDGNDFVGYLDEIRIYPYEISSSFINQRYLETRSGISKSEEIPNTDLGAGDIWMCQITPNDGLTDGTTRNSNSIQITNSTQHNRLTIAVQGPGATDPAFGTHPYQSGTAVSVAAIATPGYKLSYWLLDGNNAGSNNPYMLVMNANYTLTAVFGPSDESLFNDGFESGGFGVWSGATTVGGTSIVSPTLPHTGTYSGQFTVGTGTGSRRAYCYMNQTGRSELAANMWVYVESGLTLGNGQSMWLIQFADINGNALASFGIRGDVSGTKWAVQYASLTYALAGSSNPTPNVGRWYLLQAYFTRAASDKTIVLSVDGVQIVSLNQDTSGSSDVTNIRFGIAYYFADSTASIYVDDASIGVGFAVPSLYNVVLQSEQVDASTSNLGITIFDSVPYSLPNNAVKANNVYSATYSAALGYGFSHWVATGSVSVANVYGQWTTMTVTGSCSIKAVYFTGPIPYTLHVQTDGSGVTNSTGDTIYNKGSIIAVAAAARYGWALSYWLLDGVNIGSSNPIAVTMDNNHNLTAVFIQAASQHLFNDDFELGSFLAWSGTTTTTNGSATVESILPHNGRYSGQYSVDIGTGVKRAYSYINLSSLAESAINTYVYLADGLPLANGQNLWLIQFVDSNSTALASYGIRGDTSGNRWAAQYGSTAYGLSASQIPGPVEGRWYLLQAYYDHASTGPTVILSINGAPLVSLSQDTSGTNSIASARIGIVYYSGTSIARTYFDDLTIDSYATPPSLFSFSLRSVQDDALTKNLGFTIFDSVNYTLSSYVSKIAGSYTLVFSAASGYVFSHWVATGSVAIANVYSQSTTITVYGSGSLQAFYSLATTYNQIFSDGFESGSFSRWTGTTITTGNSAYVTSTLPRSGVYSGQFNVLTGAGTRRAYSYVTIGSLAQLTASAYVYFNTTSLANGQSMWLIQSMDPSGNALASFGVRADASGSRWAVQYGNLVYALAASDLPAPSAGQWYLLRANYVHASTGPSILLSVDGVTVISLNADTSGDNNVATIRLGIGYYDASSAVQAYIDDVAIER